ncbi:MAG: MurR/RpiR family transcriptional regulator [Clostridia bacterium]|nr:MurR/RpiR family transcriptional regulator [Clostridia bacterium]
MEALLKKLKNGYMGFSKGQRKIADYIMNAYEEAAFMTAARLGGKVGVSESTVVRFAYELGLDGYPALQAALQELLRNRLTSVQRIRLASGIPQQDVLRTVLTADMNNIRATIDMIDNDSFQRAVEAILSARRIYVLGVRSAMALAQFLTYYLDYVCDNVVFVVGGGQDTRERMLRIQEGDLCFGISFPRYSARTVEALRYARERGATLLAVTDQPDSPVALMSDITLCARSDMASFADSLVAPLSLINALIVAVGMRRNEAACRHLSRLEEIWRDEGVYLSEAAHT